MPSPETEFSNILAKIESLTGKELTANRTRAGKCNSNDAALLCEVQNMLVNKPLPHDALNDIVRRELLLVTVPSGANGHHQSLTTRKSILDNPIDARVLSETVEMVKSLSDLVYQPLDACELVDSPSAADPMLASHVLPFDQSPATRATPPIDCGPTMSDKLAKQAQFLGIDQPPPPTFPKLVHSSNIYFKPQNFNLLSTNALPVIPPFVTPGMIEHQSAFANYNSHFLYQYPILFPNSSVVPPSVVRVIEFLSNFLLSVFFSLSDVIRNIE